MNYLTFLRIRLFDVKACVEAPLLGRWRLIEHFEADYRNFSGEISTGVSEITETLWLEIRNEEATFYSEITSGVDGEEPEESHRIFYPYRFDPQSGLLVVGSRFLRVLRLTEDELSIFVLAKIGWGIVSQEKYRREKEVTAVASKPLQAVK